MQRYSQLIPLTAVLGLALWTATALGADADAKAQKTFDKLMGAIEAGDKDSFVADATDALKQAITQQVMDALAKQVGSRLKKKHATTYLCELKQSGHQVHLWKLAFEDGKDDVVVRVSLKDGKVGGFLL